MLFTVLLARVMTSGSLGRSLFSSLFLFLYAGLFITRYLWLDMPRWLQESYTFLFFLGTASFVSLFFYTRLKKKREFDQAIRKLKKKEGFLYETIVSCRLLAQAELGALIVLERNQDLKKWIDTGTKIDARLSKEVLFSIFTPPGALHDGATILRGGTIVAAGVIVPLTENPNMPRELGTRHRAAVGFSEATDCLCLVVSEESGSISIADRGSLYYDIPFEKLPSLLEKALRFKLEKKKTLMWTMEPQPA